MNGYLDSTYIDLNIILLQQHDIMTSISRP